MEKVYARKFNDSYYTSISFKTWEVDKSLKPLFSAMDQNSCPGSFVELHYKDAKLSSQCKMLKWINVENYAECVQKTCDTGGNTFNYLNGLCQIRMCEGNDYKLTTSDKGWYIATLAGTYIYIYSS